MQPPRRLAVRPAEPSDRNALGRLVRFTDRVHTHLDWKSVDEWLGAQPFLLAERGTRLVAALACPPDPPDTAWIRLLAIEETESAQAAWHALWPEARTGLLSAGVQTIAGLSLAGWSQALYVKAGFTRTHDVIVLQRRLEPPTPAPSGPARIRPAQPADHDTLIDIDTQAFAPPWQHSPALLRLALHQADWLSVAEVEGRIVGYQLSTPSQEGGHLARLAVRPAWQGRGIGAALVVELIQHYRARGARTLSVNTQDTNAASLAVYRRLGFELTGTRYPVFQHALG